MVSLITCTLRLYVGYAQNGRGEEALRLLVDMIRSRLRPDQYTLVSILVACSGLASLTEGKQTHALVVVMQV
ncbi:putative tetratricopeptide-like helical domain superfamily [Helianthus annuus]|nr:putative tetratricopeptide-like helical domain superfamily [Helianthus annuus]